MGRQERSRSDPQHIGKILDAFFKQKGIEEPIRAHRAVVFWESLVGDALSRHARAVQVERGRLIVEVESPGWMHRLQMEEQELRNRINQHLGENTIRQIRFRLGSTSTLEPGSASDSDEQEG